MTLVAVVKSFGFRALAFLVGTLAVVVTAELVVRAAGFSVHPGDKRALHELRLDRPWLYGLRPGYRGTLPATGDVVYEINVDGFRDERHEPEPPRDRFRILVLGSSITFGWGVSAEQRYTDVLELVLSRRMGAPVEVLNMGVNGYNAYNQAALLKDRGLDYEPDLVLAEFNSGGLYDPGVIFDIQTRLHLGMIPAAAFPDPAQRRPPPRFATLLTLCRSLRTCSLIDDAILVHYGTEPDMGDIGKLAKKQLDLSAGPEREWLRARYGEMAESAAAVGARFAVIAFPEIRQLAGALSGELQDELVALGAQSGWPVLNLLPVFLEATREGGRRLLIDPWHPNPDGHELAARAIADWLENEGMVEAIGSGRGEARALRLSRNAHRPANGPSSTSFAGDGSHCGARATFALSSGRSVATPPVLFAVVGRH